MPTIPPPSILAIYARISTAKQSPEPQLQELRAHAALHSLPIAAEYVDIASGAKASRPSLDRMLAEAQAKGVTCILAVKLDRIGRSVLNIANLIQDLDKRGIGLLCPGQGIDTRQSSSIGRLQVAMLSAIAAFERDLIRERTLEGLKVARAKGIPLGRPSKKLVANPEAVIAQWITEPTGTIRQLADRLGGVSLSFAHRLGAKRKREFFMAGRS